MMAPARFPTPLTWLRLLFAPVIFPQAIAHPETKPLLGRALLVLFLPAVLLYPAMNFYLLEPDEGRYAQIPREMLQSGNYIVPTLMGEPYLDKPPLFYWLVTLSYRLFGVNETAARLVPAICVHLTILAVYWLGRRSVGERAAFWAAFLLGVSPGFIGVARFLILDGLLTFCVTTSILCGYEAVRTGTFRRKWWIIAAVFSGLGFLTKGPISEVLFFPPMIAFAWLTRSTARVKWYDVLLFAGIVVGVNLPWYIAIDLKQPGFAGYFFWEHNVLRFARAFDHLQPVWYYAPVMLFGFLPGTLLFIPYVRSVLRGDGRTRSLAGGFWLVTGLWCLAFFSISSSKLPTYILPAYAPLCLALGDFIARSRWHIMRTTPILLGFFAVLIGAVHFVAVPWYARERSPMKQADVVEKYVGDPTVTVVSYPRNVDSVAFYTGRSDIIPVRSKDANKLIRESHLRHKTVILFTHNHSLEGFKETIRGAVNCTIRVTDEVDMQRKDRTSLVTRLLGGGPWGLCDIAVVEPPAPNPAAPSGGQ